MKAFLCVLVCAFLSACGGSSVTPTPAPAASAPAPAQPPVVVTPPPVVVPPPPVVVTPPPVVVVPPPVVTPPPVTVPPPPVTGSATVTWVAPTTNTDGTPLTDLAGYHLWYGTDPSNLNQEIALPPGSLSCEVDDLASGTWYFSISDYNSAGVESAATGPVSEQF